MRKKLIYILAASLLAVSIQAAEAPKKIPAPPIPPLGDVERNPLEQVTPDANNMMLIWPELNQKKAPDATKIKKAIESKRLIDKIKHSTAKKEAERVKKNKNYKAFKYTKKQRKELQKQLKKRRFKHKHQKVEVIASERLDRALLKLSKHGLIPPIFISDGDASLWQKEFSFTLSKDTRSHQNLSLLSRLCGFQVENLGALSLLQASTNQNSKPKKISMKLENVPLPLVLVSILKAGNLNGVLPQELQRVKVSLLLKDVEPVSALKAVLKNHNLSYSKVDDIYVIRMKRRVRKKRKTKEEYIIKTDDGKIHWHSKDGKKVRKKVFDGGNEEEIMELMRDALKKGPGRKGLKGLKLKGKLKKGAYKDVLKDEHDEDDDHHEIEIEKNNPRFPGSKVK